MHIHLVFDLLAYATGAIVTVAAKRWLLPASHPVPPQLRRLYMIAVLLGVIAGSFVLGTLFLREFNVANGLLGKSILGAIVGGTASVEAFKWICGVRGSTGGLFVPGLTAGIAVGRLGCLLSGLEDNTYGIPTGAAWGWNFGDGILRHPVQLYESLSMAVLLVVMTYFLLHRNSFWQRNMFYLFCIAYGAQRFCWEFLKPIPAVAGPFTLPQLFCAGLAVYGIAMIRANASHQRV